MKIAVIGGTGQLGHYTLKHLAKAGHDTTAIGIGEPPEPGYLPETTSIIIRNTDECSIDELAELLDGYNVVVHAAGADGRALFNTPAINGFRAANVEAVRKLMVAMRKTGVHRLIILGSYYTAMHSMYPGLDLPGISPYIRSRQEQMDLAFKMAGEGLDVGILELPYIFGAAPGRTTLWGFLIEQVRRSELVAAHRGGTACVTMNQVGIAAAHACERTIGKRCYPIGSANLSYKEILTVVAESLGEKKMVVQYPPDHFMDKAIAQKKYLENNGKEAAYDPVGLLNMEDQFFYIDPLPSMQSLGFGYEDISAAIRESIRANMT